MSDVISTVEKISLESTLNVALYIAHKLWTHDNAVNFR